MEQPEQIPPQHGVKIHLPVRIAYHVLEAFLREQMKGEKIKTEKDTGDVTTYAEILDFSLEKSRLEEYDLDVFVKFKTLTTFFRNREGEVLVNLSLYFDEKEQEIMVTDYRLQGNSRGWLMNKVLPSVINTFLHKKIKSKMKFAFKEKILEQVKELNDKLKQQIKAADGFYLSGDLKTLTISDIVVGKNDFLVSVEIAGSAQGEIREIKSGKKTS